MSCTDIDEAGGGGNYPNAVGILWLALGFTADRWAELAEALRIQHLTQEAEPVPPTVHGQKYTIRAILN